MFKEFIHFIEKNNLCTRTQTVFVAVSGGIDSMVLLHLFKATGYDITAVHVNFGLRGEESDEDKRFVEARCAHLGVAFKSKHVDTKNYATSRGVSVQMAARDLRYEWFHELMNSAPGSVLATAHHVNDSGETMLLNLVRGTGIDGLTGIPLNNNGIIRPLTFATRKDIGDYAAEHSITWREDESNLDDHYHRNFLRHRVMGLLKQLNPSLDDTMSKNFSRLGAEKELMERSLSALKENFSLDSENNIRIPKKAFEGFIHKSGVLLRMIEPFGFNFSTAESIVSTTQPGKMFFSRTHQLVVDRDDLIISSSVSDVEITIEETTDLGFTNNPDVAYVDADKIGPLVLRNWEEGDFFYPLGMKGRKKLSDFFIDEKIPVTEKQSIKVLTSNNEVVWVVGKRLDDRFRITAVTKRVLIITKTKRPV
ncbi:MAG: tRNA lysidine(34) synthetase TilS [Bacteroidota bacterium]